MSDEPRTMQFLVERVCTKGMPSEHVKAMRDGFEPYLPLVVWVFVEPTATRCPCEGVTYRIDSRRPAQEQNGNSGFVATVPEAYPAVCEHMGFLIE